MNEPTNELIAAQTFELKNAQIYYFPNLIQPEVAECWYQYLFQHLQWRQETLTLYGTTHPIPRLQALYGDVGLSYQYSKKSFNAIPWSANLFNLKSWLETICQAKFNCVLANLYRDGHDCMGWHADDEAELGKSPIIASLSLGATRSFKMKHRLTNELFSLELAAGSLLIMAGTTQEFWYHSLPKRARVNQGRINLTFRYLYQ